MPRDILLEPVSVPNLLECLLVTNGNQLKTLPPAKRESFVTVCLQKPLDQHQFREIHSLRRWIFTPSNFLTHRDGYVHRYWYNTVTQESTWNPPTEIQSADTGAAESDLPLAFVQVTRILTFIVQIIEYLLNVWNRALRSKLPTRRSWTNLWYAQYSASELLFGSSCNS